MGLFLTGAAQANVLDRDVSSAGYRAHKSAIDTCRSKGTSVTAGAGGLICLYGSISSATMRTLMEERPLRTIVVDTEGGDTLAAMELGLALRKDRAALVVDGTCFSSCANYLVPAASDRLTVLDGSLIGIHGSPPRDHHRVIDDFLESKGLSRLDVPNQPNLFQEGARTYPNHVERQVVPEVRYFAKILVQEAYVTRYAELLRSIRERGIRRCQPKKGTLLIVGPRYLKMFRVGANYIWWPQDRSEIVRRLAKHLKASYSIIYDTDEYVGWTQSEGFLPKAGCLA